jgi:hypothetical protein
MIRLRNTSSNSYGSLEGFIKNMMEHEDNIKKSAIKYYGSVDKYIEALKQQPLPPEGSGKLQLKLDGLVKQIADHKGEDVSNPEVQKLVEEWKETAKQLFQMDDITEAFRGIIRGYLSSEAIIKYMDGMYGEGSTVFVGKAMEYNDVHSL